MITKNESININELKQYVDEKFILDFNLIDYFNVYFLCNTDSRFNRKYKYFEKAREFIQNNLDVNTILKKSYKLEQLMKVIFSSNQLKLLNKYFEKISIIEEIDEKTRGFLMEGAENPAFYMLSGKRNKDFIEKKILDYYCINTYN